MTVQDILDLLTDGGEIEVFSLDERETFAKARQNRRSTKARADYLEAVQRVGTAQEIFDILRVDWLEMFDEYNEAHR